MLVTVENFVRAESDMYFANILKGSGGLGRLLHARAPIGIDEQAVIRMNRDTLYSSALFDLDAGPLTVTLPDSGARFMSMMLVNQDHYVVEVAYAPGTHTFTREQAGTRYAALLIRTLVDPQDAKDLAKVHALQDQIGVQQQAAGTFEIPDWDAASQKKVRDALLVLAATTNGFSRSFGRREDVDPVLHLIGTAAGWGGNPAKDATYVAAQVPKNDGVTPYRLRVKDVPVDGFWSISVYNEQGYFEKNALDAYSLNNLTATKDADGAVSVQFGGCDGKAPNCLPITKGWNYTIRLYRPRAEIRNGTWSFPEPEPVA